MNFFKRSGMIAAGMAETHADAMRIYAARGIWMVEYLRARRRGERNWTGFFRRKHMEDRRARLAGAA